MRDQARRASALAARLAPDALAAAWKGPRVGLREIPHLAHINLRGNAAQPGFLSAVRAAVGFELPLTANTVARCETARLAWLGPDEWLLIAPEGSESSLCTALNASLANLHHAVTVVSHGHTLIRATGPEAIRLLATGCPLDLHRRSFAPPQCAQSHYRKAGVLIVATEEESALDIVVRRSFAEYLWDSLVDAGSAL